VTEAHSPHPHGSVLLIHGSAETDAVLRAVLEPRGTQVQRARGKVCSNECARPDVVVIDLDEAHHSDARSAWSDTPQVVLSSRRIDVDDAQARFLEKPFHYPALIRAVEELLAARPAA
jgi:CheY-like chemotaxis protein